MEIRPIVPADLDALTEIDGTVESSRYLHLDVAGAGETDAPRGAELSASFRLEERPLREKRIDPNRMDDDLRFRLKQIASGADEGVALVAGSSDDVIALVLAQARPELGTLHVYDLRIDYDYRRQGIGTALVYQVIAAARALELRAVSMETRTNNVPACQLLRRCGFELSGVDARRHSNHDIVKESATLFWYLALD